jgi:hydroxypyruvate reductase/glycerate 2-kinase
MPLANDARTIFDASLEAILPKNRVQKSLKFDKNALHVKETIYPLRPNQRIFCFGSGKAAHTMAQALWMILEEQIHGGLIVSPQGGNPIGTIKHLKGTHPIPDNHSLQSGQALLDAMSALNGDDFYIYLLSGGSSALIEALHDGVSLEDLQSTTRTLLSHNLPITTINAVRKRLSRIKGGGLAKATPAKGIVLVVSDVIGDNLQTIGSAPLMIDDAHMLSIPSGVYSALPSSVQNALRKNPAPEDTQSPPHHLIATNRIALEAAAKKAHSLGYKTQIITDSKEGLAQNVAAQIYADINQAKSRTCLLYGGEPTVEITGDGKGGRNQHVVLNFLSHLDNDSNIALLSAGTDGIDGNSLAAGAYGDKNILQNAQKLGLDIDEYILTCNAYEFFTKTQSTIMTGPTGTNVMDILIALKE